MSRSARSRTQQTLCSSISNAPRAGRRETHNNPMLLRVVGAEGANAPPPSSKTSADLLQDLSSIESIALMDELTQLCTYATEVFDCLDAQFEARRQRLNRLARTDEVRARVREVEEGLTEMTDPTSFFAFAEQGYTPRPRPPLSGMLKKGSRSPALEKLLAGCEPPPPLHAMDELFAKVLPSNQSNRIPFAKRFSDPGFFMEEWSRSEEEELKRLAKEQKLKKDERKKAKKAPPPPPPTATARDQDDGLFTAPLVSNAASAALKQPSFVPPTRAAATQAPTAPPRSSVVATPPMESDAPKRPARPRSISQQAPGAAVMGSARTVNPVPPVRPPRTESSLPRAISMEEQNVPMTPPASSLPLGPAPLRPRRALSPSLATSLTPTTLNSSAPAGTPLEYPTRPTISQALPHIEASPAPVPIPVRRRTVTSSHATSEASSVMNSGVASSVMNSGVVEEFAPHQPVLRDPTSAAAPVNRTRPAPPPAPRPASASPAVDAPSQVQTEPQLAVEVAEATTANVPISSAPYAAASAAPPSAVSAPPPTAASAPPAAASAPPASLDESDPLYKFRMMLKMNMPQPAVEQAMRRANLDPRLLFGNDAGPLELPSIPLALPVKAATSQVSELGAAAPIPAFDLKSALGTAKLKAVELPREEPVASNKPSELMQAILGAKLKKVDASLRPEAKAPLPPSLEGGGVASILARRIAIIGEQGSDSDDSVGSGWEDSDDE